MSGAATPTRVPISWTAVTSASSSSVRPGVAVLEHGGAKAAELARQRHPFLA